MSKVKSRNQARGFGKILTRQNSDHERFLRSCEEFPELHKLWALMVGFVQIANTLTQEEATSLWITFWQEAVPILGRANVGAQHFFWLTRIKGVTLLCIKELANSLGELSMLEFIEKSKRNLHQLGETTIEVGLAFRVNHVLYSSQSLILYRGNDSSTEKGELMIAVKHASGCWTHRPSPENLCVPLSDYKKAKSALKKFPTPLKGELINFQSKKLAKILGLVVEGDYAHLIK